MSIENEKQNNARRLAYCLYQYKDDATTIKRLAAILHYLPEQLQKDIADLEAYTTEKARSDREAEQQ